MPPYIVWLVGYLPFFVVAYWVHDMPQRGRQFGVVAGLAGLVVAALLLFAGVLKWI